MAIHHATVKRAAKMGVTLDDGPSDTIRAFWPERAIEVFGASVDEAMKQMQAAQALYGIGYRVKPREPGSRLCSLWRIDENHEIVGKYDTPFTMHQRWQRKENLVEALEPEDDAAEQQKLADALSDTTALEDQQPVSNTKPIERINGIAIDGAIAYSEGTPAGDCPYSSETEDDEEYAKFGRWNEEWDAAADEAVEHEESEGGSVVSQKYRAKYAEAGHPTHCGDWLAETLNEICLNKAGVNLELFEAICGLNGVDTSKYKREGRGWEGRIRMTGRNMVARRVYLNDGKLVLPETLGSVKQAPAEWMEQQRFKAPKKAAKTEA